MREVLVTAYPKSGTTWLLHLICDLLEGVHRDTPEMEPLTYGHPVTSDWVIVKSHYPYLEYSIPYVMDRNIIYTIRDPRDIVVSAMYYRKRNDLDEAIDQMIKSGYVEQVESWLNPERVTGRPLRVKKFISTSYEALQFYPVDELGNIIHQLIGEKVPQDRIELALDRQSFDSMTKQMIETHGEDAGRHFMRKGIVGDWRRHFNREQARLFNDYFGEYMINYGYVDSPDWWEEVRI